MHNNSSHSEESLGTRLDASVAYITAYGVVSMMLSSHQVLRERLGVQCVLGLTATATRTTALSVASHLSVKEENIIRGCTVPSNLHITVSCDENRDDVSITSLSVVYKVAYEYRVIVLLFPTGSSTVTAEHTNESL